jgi:hypothetical protein
MDLRERAEKAVQDVCATISVTLDEEQREGVANVIENALIDLMREAAKHHSVVIHDCCSADRDMAHKIADGIRQANDALIANLQGLR